MKAKLRSAEFLVDNRHRDPAVDMEMLDYAGKEVEIDLATIVPAEKPSDTQFNIKEDDGSFTYAAWMFEGSLGFKKPVEVKLPTHIEGRDTASVYADGSIAVGCQTVSPEVIDFLAAKSLAAREGTLRPPRAPRKKTGSRRRRARRS